MFSILEYLLTAAWNASSPIARRPFGSNPRAQPESYTICDLTYLPWLEEDGVDLARFPKVYDHRKCMFGTSRCEDSACAASCSSCLKKACA